MRVGGDLRKLCNPQEGNIPPRSPYDVSRDENEKAKKAKTSERVKPGEITQWTKHSTYTLAGPNQEPFSISRVRNFYNICPVGFQNCWRPAFLMLCVSCSFPLWIRLLIVIIQSLFLCQLLNFVLLADRSVNEEEPHCIWQRLVSPGGLILCSGCSSERSLELSLMGDGWV